MQAIARVNRVFRDKPAGLVVDYIGVAQNLKAAIAEYSKSDQEQTGIDEEQAISVMLEKYEIVRDMFNPFSSSGFRYQSALDPSATPTLRLTVMAGVIDWVLTFQQESSLRANSEDERRLVHRRYADAVLNLTKAFALAAASDAAAKIRDEVGFFQAIRAALEKSTPGVDRSPAARELAIQQIVSRAVVSTEIIEIVQAAGIQSPDISILSDDFLAELRDVEKKNLALEALRKLINGEVQSQSRTNVVQGRAFTERLEGAIARYHTNAINTVQVLEELIQIATDLRATRERGEESGLNEEEIAFYDALAENRSAREAMGEPQLRVIAHELTSNIRSNATVDWMHRDAARARMRLLVKKILRKYGYPPDLQDVAVQLVLLQAESLSACWANLAAG
jgi:type I restriction enzyme, R subunit